MSLHKILKIIFVCTLLFLIIICSYVIFTTSNVPSIPPSPTPTSTPTLTPAPLPVGMPTYIEIPKLNLKADIVAVGLTKNNALDVPKNANQVGWYYQSVKPGQIGGAVLVGHYDSPSGRPAVFYRIRELKKGDSIIIYTSWDEKFIFKVESIVSEPNSIFPNESLYNNVANREIRLITCDGVWNLQEKNYSKRLAIFAKLWLPENH